MHEDLPTQIRIKETGDGYPILWVTSPLSVHFHPYGFAVSESDCSEWCITVGYSHGQGSGTVWTVSLLECDMGLRTLAGECDTDDWTEQVEEAIKDLTSSWLPSYRINQGLRRA